MDKRHNDNHLSLALSYDSIWAPSCGLGIIFIHLYTAHDGESEAAAATHARKSKVAQLQLIWQHPRTIWLDFPFASGCYQQLLKPITSL